MTNNPASRHGVLVAEEIEAAISAQTLVIGGSTDRVHGCSYDMTVGTVFWEGQIVSPAGRQFTVLPGGLVSIFTAEELKLPRDICATAFAINKMSSRGFLVLNPGHVDPGFEGPLTVKALNIRKTAIAIQQGDPIFTVVFEKIPVETRSYENNKSRKDREREFNAQTVEHSPSGLSEMIALNNQSPYTTRQEIRELIREHWMSNAFLGLSGLAAVAAVLSVILQFVPVDKIKPERTQQETSNSDASVGGVNTRTSAPASRGVSGQESHDVPKAKKPEASEGSARAPTPNDVR